MVLLDRLSVSATLLSNFVLIPLYKIFLECSASDEKLGGAWERG